MAEDVVIIGSQESRMVKSDGKGIIQAGERYTTEPAQPTVSRGKDRHDSTGSMEILEAQRFSPFRNGLSRTFCECLAFS